MRKKHTYSALFPNGTKASYRQAKKLYKRGGREAFKEAILQAAIDGYERGLAARSASVDPFQSWLDRMAATTAPMTIRLPPNPPDDLPAKYGREDGGDAG